MAIRSHFDFSAATIGRPGTAADILDWMGRPDTAADILDWMGRPDTAADGERRRNADILCVDDG